MIPVVAGVATGAATTVVVISVIELLIKVIEKISDWLRKIRDKLISCWNTYVVPLLKKVVESRESNLHVYLNYGCDIIMALYSANPG